MFSAPRYGVVAVCFWVFLGGVYGMDTCTGTGVHNEWKLWIWIWIWVSRVMYERCNSWLDVLLDQLEA